MNRDDLVFILNLIDEIFEKLSNDVNEKFKSLENKFENLEREFERFKIEIETDVELLQTRMTYYREHQGNVEVINPTSMLNNRGAIFEDEEPIPLFKNF